MYLNCPDVQSPFYTYFRDNVARKVKFVYVMSSDDGDISVQRVVIGRLPTISCSHLP